jgi:hypothetical protein
MILGVDLYQTCNFGADLISNMTVMTKTAPQLHVLHVRLHI